MRRTLLLLTLGAALGIAGCGSTQLIGAGPYSEANAKSARRSAVRYFLAKDILLVEAEIKQSRVTSLRAENDGAGHFTFGTRTRVKFDSSVATITPETVPDTSAFFQLELENGDASEDNVTVVVTERGLLRSVNATAASQAGEIVKNVAQIAATVVGVAGALAGRDPGIVTQIYGLFDKEAQSAPRLKESLAALPLDVLYLLQEQADARALWAKKLRLEALLQKRRNERNELEDAIQRLTKGDVEVFKVKRDLLDTAIKRTESERKALIDLLEVELDQLRQDKHLTPEPISRKIAVAFELDEVPPGILEAGMDPVEVKTRLLEGHYLKMAQLFEDAGVVFTLTPPKIAPDDPNAAPRPGVAPPPEPTGPTEGRFYFRQSYPLVLRSFAKATLPPQPQLAPPSAKPANVETKGKASASPVSQEVGDKEQIRFVEDRVVDLIPPNAPQLFVSFAPKDFATRRLALRFDPKGRLERLERSSTSSLGGATAALADTAAKARDEYATTMQRLLEIQDTRRALSLEQVQGQIERAQKQKELLDARVSLEGDQATSSLSVQKQQLDAELAALQARAAYEGQRGGVAQESEIAALKAKLDRLAADFAALQAKINADSGGRGQGQSPAVP